MLFKSQLDRPLSLKKERERERRNRACAFLVSESSGAGGCLPMNGFGRGALTQGFSAAALPAKMAAFACVSLGRQDLPGRDTGLSCSPGMLLPLWA